MSAKTGLHQGRLLKALVAWTNLSQDAFVKKIGLSRVWLVRSFKSERIRLKNLLQITKTFNVPMEYFEGKITLDNISSTSDLSKVTKKEDDGTREIILKLQMDLLESKDEIIRLQRELLKYHIIPNSS